MQKMYMNELYMYKLLRASQRKRMNHARITHRFSILRGACVVCVIRRCLNVDRKDFYNFCSVMTVIYPDFVYNYQFFYYVYFLYILKTFKLRNI